jgi:hypothetical protein
MLQYAIHTFHNDGILKRLNKLSFIFTNNKESLMKTSYTTHATSMLCRWKYFLGVLFMVASIIPAIAVSQVAPSLGTSSAFGILAAGAISGSTTVTGNVGTTTGAIDGTILAPGYTVYASGNATVVTAHGDFTTAYTNALAANSGGTSLPATFPVASQGNDGAHPLLAGIYAITDPASMNVDLYLSGSASDIFIFKASGTFNTTSGTVIHLAGGAVRTNVYWLVGGAVTLGAGSSVFEGTILCNNAITVGATAIVHGALLGNGAVTVNAASVLPVELVSFTATGTRSGAVLAWKTATEKNNFGFNVERRTIGSSVWNKIGFVAGHGTSDLMNSYNYADANVAAGSYAYRVAQVDNDGTVKTYNESQVTVGAAAKTLTLGNYPNPFNPTTTFEFSVPNDGLTIVKIYNVLGQEVLTAFSGEVKAGTYQHATFDGSKFSSGVYFYSVENNGQRMIKKMLMMK